jgi:hypothetical protein
LKSFAIFGLIKEVFSNASKFDLLSVKIIVEPGSFAAKADASSREYLYTVHLIDSPSLSRLCI